MAYRLELVGGVRILREGQPVESLAGHRQKLAFLAYLAVQPGSRASRERLLALFWPERDESSARHSLSQLVYELRREAPDLLEATADSVRLLPSAFDCDALQFQEAARAGDVARAVTLYTGEFLEGFSLPGSGEFERWIEDQRAQLQRLHRKVAREHVAALRTQAQLESAIEAARRWLAADPFEDEAHHTLIELLFLVGERTAALEHYDRYAKLCKDELGVEPLDETRALAERMRAGDPGRRVEGAERTPSAAPPPSVGEPSSAAWIAGVGVPAHPRPRPGSLLGELKRRHVFHVAAVYALVAWIVIQVAVATFPNLHLPPWTTTLVVVLAFLGFPIALVLAWAFELTPEGVRRTEPVVVAVGPPGVAAAPGLVFDPPPRELKALLRELVARRVLFVFALYLGVVILALRAIGPLGNRFGAPGRIAYAVYAALGLALPLILGLAWASGRALSVGSRAPSRAILVRVQQIPAGLRWIVAVRPADIMGLLGLAILGLVAALLLVAPALPRGKGLDPALHVVLPFGYRGDVPPSLLSGEQCQLLLYESLSRWEDAKVVNSLLVHDALARGGEPSPLRLRSALEVARDLGAGLLAWGEVWTFGDTTYVRGALHDVGRRGAVVREHTVRIAKDRRDLGAKFDELADSLLIGRPRAASAISGSMGTTSLKAWQAYENGHTALAAWDLESAERAFREASAVDPSYAHANLWLAQVMAWTGAPTESWRGYASRAVTYRDRLGPRERSLAVALDALAAARFPAACEIYRGILERDSLDFSAWYGLGECHSRDTSVVPDPSSPSGWSFRGSYHTAVDAYVRALRITPSVHVAFRGFALSPRLPKLLITEANRYRLGSAAPPDTGRFAAFPSLEDDTLAFVPYPLSDVLTARLGALPPATAQALARNRSILREIAHTWVRSFPGSAAAYETLALVLETTGDLSAGPPERSALGAIRQARRLASESDERLRLTNAEVRLLLKLEGFPAARALADSLLRAWPDPQPREAQELAILAALTGRTRRTADLLRRTATIDTLTTLDGKRVPAPLPVTEAAFALLGYASLGAPAESIISLERQVEQLIQKWVEPDRQPLVRRAALDGASMLAFPHVILGAIHRGRAPEAYLLFMQSALARGDSAAVRARFAKARAVRASQRPGDQTLEGVYQEAWLLLALGDTADATELLDSSLEALPMLGTFVLIRVPEFPALVRAMSLRADLAARAGDARAAGRWARAVTELWGEADPELQPLVERMRALLQPSGRKD